MEHESLPPRADPPKPSLEYARPDLKARPAPRPCTPLIWGMAVAWAHVVMFSGVSSDRIRIPLPKKIGITVSGAIIALAMAYTANTGGRAGCLIVFLLAAMALIGVTWFWN